MLKTKERGLQTQVMVQSDRAAQTLHNEPFRALEDMLRRHRQIGRR